MRRPPSRISFLLTCLPILGVGLLRADWADDVGYKTLQKELGTSIPTGSGLKVTQVEAEVATGAWSPVAGTGDVAVNTASFVNKTFAIKNGPALYSWHANDVVQQFYGSAPANPRYGMAPGVGTVDVHLVDNWWDTTFIRLGGPAPPAETSVVANHSWIYEPADNSEDAALIETLRRFDYSINNSNYVACVGMNNDGSNVVPALMASAANCISVGLTSGAHSRGLTSTSWDVPGRTKPEIVAPLDFTSFATGLVSGGVTMLRSAATTTAAQRNETLRAVLLAGATKGEFPNWARTTARPLDAIYGAGEMNVAHSYHILQAGLQASSSTTPVALLGWDYRSMTANTDFDYVLQIPTSLQGASLSAVLVWNRPITITGNGANRVVNAPTVPNLKLTLYKEMTSSAQWDVSDSPVDNLEHIWQPALTAGNYRLRVRGDLTVNASLAWRVIPAEASPVMLLGSRSGNQLNFQLKNLVPSQLYEIQTSETLTSWTVVETLSATALSQAWTSPSLTGVKHFFRLKWTVP